MGLNDVFTNKSVHIGVADYVLMETSSQSLINNGQNNFYQ